MGTTTSRGPIGRSPLPLCEARTPGTLGILDQADPDVLSLPGDTPGPTGFNDLAQWVSGTQNQTLATATPTMAEPADMADSDTAPLSAEPVSGAVAVGTGQASVARIPVPGSKGLFIELSPRGYVPKSGSTSTLFIQDTTGKRHLRLDYGYNKNTGTVDYHWNQKGTYQQFGIQDHTATGKGGSALYKTAKYLKYGGRVLLVVGAAVDTYSIVVSRKRWRQVSRVAAGWTGAWAGCKLIGAGGAAAGSVVPGKGTAIGGIIGCIAGGIGVYTGASWAAGEIYDLIEETYFEPLPEAPSPD